jgi:hypothetical protein
MIDLAEPLQIVESWVSRRKLFQDDHDFIVANLKVLAMDNLGNLSNNSFYPIV